MTWSDLGEPRPKDAPSAYEPLSWPSGHRIQLPEHVRDLGQSWARALAGRHTRRSFGSYLDEHSLGELFALACRTRATQKSALGFPLEFRPYPSAGALHPVHLLVQIQPGQAWYRYDARHHTLDEVPSSAGNADAARALANEFLAVQPFTVLAFVAEPGRTAVKYQDPQSLVLRDAGVLIGYLSLVSELLELSFCPLGALGDSITSKLPGLAPGLQGVGFAAVGFRSI